ncbi:MAG TPA: PepSY domain-containing protein [Nitrospiraceae bacterium]|nr:PepSY domain-containing protein [Nitrospiraceae bacterium]
MNKKVPIRMLALGITILAGAVLVVGEPVFSKEAEHSGSTQRFRGIITGAEKARVPIEKERAKLASQAKVTLEQAIKTAREKVPGNVVGAELEYKPQEMAVWELDVLSVEGKEIHMSVDAATGELLETGR